MQDLRFSKSVSKVKEFLLFCKKKEQGSVGIGGIRHRSQPHGQQGQAQSENCRQRKYTFCFIHKKTPFCIEVGNPLPASIRRERKGKTYLLYTVYRMPSTSAVVTLAKFSAMYAGSSMPSAKVAAVA